MRRTAVAAPPVHYEITRTQFVFSVASIAAAAAGLAALAIRLALNGDLWRWWTPAALAAGMLAADFGSGVVHWAADSWGRDDLPVIGHRLLVPFRVHHVNPDDFLRRSFVDTNGDVAFVAALLSGALLVVPIAGPLSVFGLAFCGVGTMTNQIHQWAHMSRPPRIVSWLQRSRVILGRAEHAVHHGSPYDVHYCITTGWCNRPLEAMGFFRWLETAITRVTGARPRQDDERYEERYGSGSPSFAGND